MRFAPTLVFTLLIITAAGGCTNPRIATVEAFTAAKASGDLDAARALLAADPRTWWGSREGAGAPMTLEGGRWSGWDDHFNGRTTRLTPWRAEDDRVWADMRETNEYYRLTGRSDGVWRRTYFFDAAGRIAGTMIGPVDDPPPTVSRFDEFEAWAREHHPDELAHLMPEGAIDPTGDRPARFRALLNAWRAEIGLAPIERGR